MRDARKLVVAVLVLVAAAALAACGGDDGTSGTSSEESEPVMGQFEPLRDIPVAYLRVAGEAELERSGGGTTVSITVSGLEPETPYIAHLHTGRCDQPEPGGPHFQFEKGGSEEPPNEIHLEFTSNASGEGRAEVTSKREVPVGEAGSIVLHTGENHHATTSFESGSPEAETVFVHEGVDHSKEGAGHPGGGSQHAHSDEIACAELEGRTASESGLTPEGESTADSGDVPTIVVRDGEPVNGIEELEYSAGDEIRFRVSSDAAEEIHVHGYDISKDVPAGGTIEFSFPAELEGIYEAELEKLGVQIAELQINP